MNPIIQATAQAEKVGSNLIVQRALPNTQLESVGPFVFLDHFGPIASHEGGPSAHPHAGIEVITWLFEGDNRHRDSMGNEGRIQSGGAQWMKSGRGAIHAETMYATSPITYGLQLWARQAIEHQECDPQYQGFQADEIPSWSQQDAHCRLLMGHYAAHQGPLKLDLDAFAMRVEIAAHGTCYLDLPTHDQYAVYVMQGEVTITPPHHDPFAASTHIISALPPNASPQTIHLQNPSDQPLDLVILGGQAAPQPLVFGGPFVFESHGRIVQAKRDFISGKMGQLEGVPF